MSDKKISQLTASTTPLAGTEVLPIVQSGVTKKTSVESVALATQPSGTANSVIYLNGSKVPTTDSALKFDGQNLGLGTTPSIWGTGNPAVDMGSFSSFSAATSTSMSWNAYYDGTNWRRKLGFGLGCSLIESGNQETQFKYAASGDANSTISWLTAFRTDSSGDAIFNQNIVIATSGKGIDFSADGQAAGMTSELLDDYEEGTWTPEFVGSGSYPWTFTITSSIYTKVGRLVYVNTYGTMTATTNTTADNFYIGGVPFASANCKLAGQVTIDGASDTIYFLAASNLFSNTAIIPSTASGASRSFSICATYSV